LFLLVVVWLVFQLTIATVRRRRLRLLLLKMVMMRMPPTSRSSQAPLLGVLDQGADGILQALLVALRQRRRSRRQGVLEHVARSPLLGVMVVGVLALIHGDDI